jgi:hypothetical protein
VAPELNTRVKSRCLIFSLGSTFVYNWIAASNRLPAPESCLVLFRITNARVPGWWQIGRIAPRIAADLPAPAALNVMCFATALPDYSGYRVISYSKKESLCFECACTLRLSTDLHTRQGCYPSLARYCPRGVSPN